MAHADRSDPVDARRGSFSFLQRHGALDGAGPLQLDMFGAPPQAGCDPDLAPDLAGMRAELREILGADAAAPKPSGADEAQLRLAFLRAELARVDAA
jgi:hypothetical protein